MGDWHGGINYGYIIGNSLEVAAADLDFMRAVGIKSVRLNICPYNNSGQISFWRTITQMALARGFYVVHGVTFPHSGNGAWLTQSQWANLRQGILAEASWAATLDNPDLEIQLGNELERQRYVTISSLTRSGSTATATSSYAHQLQQGSTVIIRGATPADYNGSHTITVINSTQFSFSIDSGVSTPATGTIRATDFSDSGIIASILSMATAAAAIYPHTISYACPAGSPDSTGSAHQIPSHWAAAGTGALTRLGFNLYEAVPRFFDTMYTTITTSFPAGKTYLSEWGLDSNGAMAATYNDEELLRHKLRAREERFRQDNLDAYYFEYLDPNDLFGLRLMDGSLRKSFADLLRMRAWYWPGNDRLERQPISRQAHPHATPRTYSSPRANFKDI